MSTGGRLQSFATAILHREGGLVEWPPDASSGEVMLTPNLASALGCGEVARIGTGSVEVDLRLDLAGDLLERLQALASGGPWIAAARPVVWVPRKLEAAGLVERSVDVANARVKLVTASAAAVEYHLWHMAVSLTGEESWEDVVPVAINTSSGRSVSLITPTELVPWKPVTTTADTAPPAVRAALVAAGNRSAAFVERLATRRERDRKRLRDYYGALKNPPRRTGRASSTLDPKERQARDRAVDLELGRKLDEVDERHRLRVRVQPVALLRLELPAWTVDITVQRRTAVRQVRLWWNPIAGGLELPVCAACGADSRAFMARDTDAAMVCRACAG